MGPLRTSAGRRWSGMCVSACGLKAAALGLQVFPQRARPTMPRKTCGSPIFRTALQVQGLEAAALIRQAAAVLLRQAAAMGLQVFPQRTPMP